MIIKDMTINIMMTLEEEILYYEEKPDCRNNGKEYEQLAEWLKELKWYREMITDDGR